MLDAAAMNAIEGRIPFRRAVGPRSLSHEEAACARAKQSVGGPVALSKKIGGVSSQAVSQWRVVPVKRVKDVAAATGMTAVELRRDIFAPAAKGAFQ